MSTKSVPGDEIMAEAMAAVAVLTEAESRPRVYVVIVGEQHADGEFSFATAMGGTEGVTLLPSAAETLLREAYQGATEERAKGMC